MNRVQPAGGGERLARLETEQHPGPRIHRGLAIRQIVLPGAEAGRLERQLERVLLAVELLLDAPVLGLIAQPTGVAQQTAVPVVHGRGGDRSPEATAVLPHQPAVGGEPAHPLGLGQILGGGAALPRLWRIEVHGRGPEEFRLLVPQDPPNATVPAGRPTLGVEQNDRVVLHLVERRAEPLGVVGPSVARDPGRVHPAPLDLVVRRGRRGRRGRRRGAASRRTVPGDEESTQRQGNEEDQDGRREVERRRGRLEQRGE